MKSTGSERGRAGTQLRSVVAGVRPRRSADVDREGDPNLVALTAEPYGDVDEARQRLLRLQRAFEGRGDRRALFLSVYARMTGAVAERIGRGGFEDPEWVSAYLVAFTNLYREGVHAYETGDVEALADAWLLAFDAARREDCLVVQDTALGVNAHINYDLALALDRIGLEPSRERKFADHAAVTEVVRGILDETQAALADRDAPGLGTVDEALGSFDERALVFTIDQCRDSAWRTAVALRSRFSLRRRLARWTNDVTSAGAARLILSSRTSDRIHDSLLAFEGGTGAPDGAGDE